jgi:hypothetical protein
LARSTTPNGGFGLVAARDEMQIRDAFGVTEQARQGVDGRIVRYHDVNRYRFGRGADCDRIRKQHSQRSAFGFVGSDERGRAITGN